MKSLRAVLIVFMAFFCVVGAILLVRDFGEAMRSLDDPEVDPVRVVGVLIARMLVCAFFAWLAVAMWKKNRRPADPP
jgi:hypothetical protein